MDKKNLLPRTSLRIVSPPSLAAAWSRLPAGHGKASVLLWPYLHGCGPLLQGVESEGRGGGAQNASVSNIHSAYPGGIMYELFLLIKGMNTLKVNFNDHAQWLYISRCVSVRKFHSNLPGGTRLLLWHFLLFRFPPMISTHPDCRYIKQWCDSKDRTNTNCKHVNRMRHGIYLCSRHAAKWEQRNKQTVFSVEWRAKQSKVNTGRAMRKQRGRKSAEKR